MRDTLNNFNNIDDEQKLRIAKQILKECYWNNTRYTTEDIISNAQDYFLAKTLFSAIFQNSRHMFEALRLIRLEWVVEFIKNQKIANFRKEDFTRKKDILIHLFIDRNHLVYQWKI